MEITEQPQQLTELAEAQQEIARLKICLECDRRLALLLLADARMWQKEAWLWIRRALENMPSSAESREIQQGVTDWVKAMEAMRESIGALFSDGRGDGRQPVGAGHDA